MEMNWSGVDENGQGRELMRIDKVRVDENGQGEDKRGCMLSDGEIGGGLGINSSTVILHKMRLSGLPYQGFILK